MKSRLMWGFVLVALVGVVLGCQSAGKGGTDTLSISSWLVLGPFAAPAETPGQAQRGDYTTDYLKELGGEESATITKTTTVSDGPSRKVTPVEATVAPDHSVDLAKLFGETKKSAVYAFATVRSPRAQQAECFFGSDDWAKVWVNGKQVHAIYEGEGRPLKPRQEHFAVDLLKGENKILVKVDQDSGPWGFALELVTGKEAEKIRAEETRLARIRAFQNAEIGPKMQWDYCFPPGEFPAIDWRSPELVQDLYGKMPLTVRWFDGQLNEVKRAEAPGRYAAYVEATKPDGTKIRRAMTFYCRPANYEPWRTPPLKIQVPFPGISSIDPQVWNEQHAYVSSYVSGSLIDSFFTKPEGAAFLAGLSELKPLNRPPTQLDEPPMLDQDYHLRLKLKILGAAGKYPHLAPPKQKAGAPTTVLHAGTLAQAGFKPSLLDSVRAIGKEWSALEGQPLTVLVARHGVIAMCEAFGANPEGPVTVDTKFPLASLTKCHAGLMLAQFIDQGLISLDDPVGKYLPDYPTTGNKVITLRNCVTHTTGFEGHGEFHGMSNPWLDNVLVNGLELIQPGSDFLYNGMGFDLAGKVMEVVSGKSFFRLMHENYFIPMGYANPTMVDLGYGIDCTVNDLAKLGQMLLNKGSYGNVQLFGEETFERVVRPHPLKEFYPNIKTNGDNRYNLGLTVPMDARAPKPGDTKPPARLFSDNALWHGAASGAILRVDPDKDLVIASSRYTPGKDYALFCTRLLEAIVDSME